MAGWGQLGYHVQTITSFSPSEGAKKSFEYLKRFRTFSNLFKLLIPRRKFCGDARDGGTGSLARMKFSRKAFRWEEENNFTASIETQWAGGKVAKRCLHWHSTRPSMLSCHCASGQTYANLSSRRSDELGNFLGPKQFPKLISARVAFLFFVGVRVSDWYGES